MKNSRLRAVLAILVTVAVFAAMFFLIFFAFQYNQDKLFMQKMSGQEIMLSASFTVTAQTGCMNTVENSYLSAKAGLISGAQAISADISFRKDGVPVLAEKLSQADVTAVTVERIFDYLAGLKDPTMILNLKQLTNISEIDRLAVERELTNRLIYTGINEDQVAYLQYGSPNIRFYIDANPKSNQMSDPVYCEGLAEVALSKGAFGINCSYKHVTKTFVEAVHKYRLMFSVYDVEKEVDMYRMLDFGVDNITTKSPDILLGIISKIQAKAALH
ncbi:MAG: glycerophosphodiester phosphodiesterase family protein [Eubacteriales bacterium]